MTDTDWKPVIPYSDDSDDLFTGYDIYQHEIEGQKRLLGFQLQQIKILKDSKLTEKTKIEVIISANESMLKELEELK